MKLSTGPRTLEQVREQYRIERELADRLRAAPKEQRGLLYGSVYNELFQRVPHHPQLTRILKPGELEQTVAEKLMMIRKYLRPESAFLEIGAGDCRLSLEVAPKVRSVYALEVSEEITKSVRGPANFKVLLSKGTDIPLASGTIDVAYSYQVMEHIHPDDALEQLANIYQCLAPGGIYICVTPSRLNGPHDVSKYFDDVAHGFHIREYSLGEVGRLMVQAGFENIRLGVGFRGHLTSVPVGPVAVLENRLELLPHAFCKRVVSAPLLRNIFLAPVIGQKRAP